MNVRIPSHTGLGLLLAAAFLPAAWAEEPAPRRVTPIIFSAPESDTVSSNLNQISSRGSPLLQLESGLKKPFEIFESSSPSERFRPSSVNPPPPTSAVNNRKLKELIQKRADEIYLSVDDVKASAQEENLFGDNALLLGTTEKPKTALDYYYDRIDRTRSALTNQAPTTDIFGKLIEPEGRDTLNGTDFLLPLASGISGVSNRPTESRLSSFFDSEFSAGMNANQNFDSATAERRGFTTEATRPRPTERDSFVTGASGLSDRARQAREARFDEFKRLLEGPGYAPSSSSINPPPPATVGVSTYQPAKPAMGIAAPAASGISSTWPVAPASGGKGTFAGTAGLVGDPSLSASVPDYAASPTSLTPTPSVEPARPLTQPTFNVPKRRF